MSTKKKKVRRYLTIYRIRLVISGLSVSILAIIGLPWLAAALLFAYVMYLMLLSCTFIRRHRLVSVPLTLIGVVFLAVFTRLFIAEMYHVPSESMEDALAPEDNIIVNKLNYGPRLPVSPAEIPWINLFFSARPLNSGTSDQARWGYHRLSGTSVVRRGDIMVFKKPDDDTERLVKRCIGIAGDTIQIINGTVFVNRKEVAELTTIKQRYLLWFRDTPGFLKLAERLCIDYQINSTVAGRAVALLNPEQITAFRKSNVLDSAARLIDDGMGYPWNPEIDWTPDNLGPVIIPARGSTIQLNRMTYILYEKILKRTERLQVSMDKGVCYLNGKPLRHYTFTQNCYFMMGDNRSRSNDSRFWGFVPEENIEGRVAFVIPRKITGL